MGGEDAEGAARCAAGDARCGDGAPDRAHEDDVHAAACPAEDGPRAGVQPADDGPDDAAAAAVDDDRAAGCHDERAGGAGQDAAGHAEEDGGDVQPEDDEEGVSLHGSWPCDPACAEHVTLPEQYSASGRCALVKHCSFAPPRRRIREQPFSLVVCVRPLPSGAETRTASVDFAYLGALSSAAVFRKPVLTGRH